MNEKQQATAATAFAQRWAGRGYEKGESQVFWTELLTEVFGIDNPGTYVHYEEQVKVDKTNFIDVHIPTTKVLIEQKSLGKDLRKPIRQSDGSMLTPFQQAKRYSAELPYSQRPRWIVTCNFERFLVYDMECPNGEPQEILLADLGREYYRLQFLVNVKSEHLARELEVSMQAGEIIGEIYDALLAQYGDSDAETLRLLNVMCVRLVFCLYAEDAGIFGRDQFHDYLARHDAGMMRGALLDLFKTLNTPPEQRSRFLSDDLRAFPYTNGGLFAEEIDIPQFTPELAQLLLQNASLNFDWSEISPTIFGAVFESTLNPDTRRMGGMHYTSIENIHKVIDPLFMDSLHHEFDEICQDRSPRTRRTRLLAFQDRLASLTFLDPACGSGNFLTETYLSLRRLENRVVTELTGGRAVIGFDDVTPIKVSINQFHGIEINDFAVTVATTALWISEAQMLRETERIIHHDIDFLPLRNYANIREGNALRMDWDVVDVPDDTVTIHADDVYATVVNPEPSVTSEPVVTYGNINLIASHLEVGPQRDRRQNHVHYDYIIGNPPFVGYSFQSREQKSDLLHVFVDKKGKPLKGAGKIDYVAGWYYKAAEIASRADTRVALVSTNSITQGEQVAAIWQPLNEMFGVHIDFAHRTFRWDSESTQKAHVHCVVIGFSAGLPRPCLIYDGEDKIEAKHINGYLMDADDVFIESRKMPLCDVPTMTTGNRPADGGHLIIEGEEHDSFVAREPNAIKYIKRLIGAAEYINNRKRYCLWLGGVSPAILRQMPLVYDRVKACKKDRENAIDLGRRKLAATPHLFREQLNPEAYVVVPYTSSENRQYIPIGFLDSETIPTDALRIIPNATLYHFGVLTSNVHMAWMRAVCGRLKSDYRYSKDIVYNNFPWPEASEKQRAKIEQTAQAILNARALYPDSSLADLYDDVMMPVELRKAHQQNDRAVMEVYGMPWRTTTEPQCVAHLFALYQQLTQKQG